MDWQGKHLQVKHEKWLAEQDARSKADHELQAAQQQEQRAAQHLAELQKKKTAHVEEVAIRSLIFQKIAEIETTLVNAIIAGAHKGIATNQGLKRGVIPRNSAQAVLS